MKEGMGEGGEGVRVYREELKRGKWERGVRVYRERKLKEGMGEGGEGGEGI